MLSALDASTSLLSSRTPRQSSSAVLAPPFSASLPVVRLALQKVALSGGSRAIICPKFKKIKIWEKNKFLCSSGEGAGYWAVVPGKRGWNHQNLQPGFFCSYNLFTFSFALNRHDADTNLLFLNMDWTHLGEI
jgi:hypothetical protein